MLFKNLRTGNIVAATDKTSVELMQRSAIYEAVEIAPAPTPKAEAKATKKPAAKAKAGNKAE